MIKTILQFLAAAPLMLAAVSYTYDAAGRLTKIDYGSAGSITYTYDKAGNMLSRNVATGSASGGTITSINTAGSPASAGIMQNAWIEIKGNNIVPANTPAAGVIWGSAPEFAQGKMPTQIGGVSVTINGKAAYVYFYCSAVTSSCASDQVNVLAPLDSTTGDVQVVVTSNGVASAPATVSMKAAVPSLFLFSGNFTAATHVNGTLLGPTTLYPGLTTPATKNETIVLYGTGFGLPTTPPVLGSSSQFGALPTLPVCKIGSDTVNVGFAGLIAPGLIQINLTTPNTASTTADRSISCTYNGASTPVTDVITMAQ